MSYEGYVEALCEDGHYYSWDCYDDPPKVCDAKIKDGSCQKSLVWWNPVDQTNGDGSEFEAKLELAEEAVYDTCPTCSHNNMISQVRYKIPTNQGHMYEGRSK